MPVTEWLVVVVIVVAGGPQFGSMHPTPDSSMARGGRRVGRGLRPANFWV